MTKKTKAKKKPVKRGRPRVPINAEIIGKLSEAGCSVEEMASMLRRAGLAIDARTISRRLQEPDFAQAREDGVNALRVRLRSRMVQQAMMMNGAGVHMMKFLAFNFMGMTDRVDAAAPVNTYVEIESARDSLNRKLDALAERLSGGNARLLADQGPQAVDGEFKRLGDRET